MGPVAWIVFGALAGWAANLVVGGRDKVFEFDFASFGVALLGAIALLAVLRALRVYRSADR